MTDEAYGIGKNGEIFDVTFGLYAEKELTAADGTVIPADGLIEIISLDENGSGKVKTDLPIGSYYVKELATNSAYILNEQKYPVVFEYVQENCDLLTSDNLVIYGHHIKGQKMFGALENYKSKDFYEGHKTVCFDTLTKRGEYEIIAVFKTVAYSSAGFRYYDFVDTEDENAFNAYIAKCNELALYDTGVTAEYGDRLITLSTCEYSAQNGRLVVVAKKVA